MRVLNITDDIVTPMLYGMQDNTMVDYYRNKFSNMGPMVNNDYYNNFYKNIEYKYSDKYIDEVKRTMYDMEITGNDDYNLYYYNDSRDANAYTREWIMSNQTLRGLYNRGLISGYAGSNYVHNEYSASVRYMSVMHGHLGENFDGTVEYINSDMFEVSNFERELIVRNWNRALSMFNNDIDPTE